MCGHSVDVCTCGAVISQCRCMDKNKAVKIIKDGCATCKISAGVAQSVVDDVVALIVALKGCVEEMDRLNLPESLALCMAKDLLQKYAKKETVN